MTATDLTLTHRLVSRYIRRLHPDITTNSDRDVVGYRRAIYLRSASGFAEIGHGGECTTNKQYPWWVKSGGSTIICMSLAAAIRVTLLLYLRPNP